MPSLISVAPLIESVGSVLSMSPEQDASVNLLDMLLGGQPEYDAAKEAAEGYREGAALLCGTQGGGISFGDVTADLSE